MPFWSKLICWSKAAVVTPANDEQNVIKDGNNADGANATNNAIRDANAATTDDNNGGNAIVNDINKGGDAVVADVSTDGNAVASIENSVPTTGGTDGTGSITTGPAASQKLRKSFKKYRAPLPPTAPKTAERPPTPRRPPRRPRHRKSVPAALAQLEEQRRCASLPDILDLACKCADRSEKKSMELALAAKLKKEAEGDGKEEKKE